MNDLAAEGIIFSADWEGGYICQCGFSQYQGHVQSLAELTQMIEKELGMLLPSDFKYSKSKTGGRNLFSSSDAAGRTAGSGRKSCFWQMIKICAFCRDYFGMNLIGGKRHLICFQSMKIRFTNIFHELSGEKAQWDKVEIDTVNPAEIAGLKKYVSVKELGLSPYLYLKTLNYSEKDKTTGLCE